MSKYIFKIIKNASLDKMKEAVNTVHERSGMSKRKIFNDMLHCTRKYGAGYYDYQIFAFYNLTEAQRATFMTRLISKKFNTFMNDYEYAHFLENKDEFNKLYKKYIGRDFIQFQEASKEEVREFCKKHPVMFCKMQDLECGHGCERIKTADYKSFDELYDYLKKQDFCILEENIEQHPAVKKLYPNAVNSMRFITVLDKQGEPHIIYTEHPDTHVKIQGYQIPFVREAVKMVLEAAKITPQIRYVGWDVATTPKGPAIIEGNTYCAHDFWQLPPHTPDGIGILPEIKKYVPEFFEGKIK